MAVSLADLLPDAMWDPSSDVLLDRFLRYTPDKHLALYPVLCENSACGYAAVR